MTFICWQCRKPFVAVKYIEQGTRGVSPCCQSHFVKNPQEVATMKLYKITWTEVREATLEAQSREEVLALFYTLAEDGALAGDVTEDSKNFKPLIEEVIK